MNWKRALWVALSAQLAWAQPLPPGLPLPVPEEPRPRLETTSQREARFLFDEARRYHRLGEWEQALEMYRKALARDPERWEYRPYLGQVLLKVGRAEDALEQFRLYLAQEPEDEKVLRDRLWAWIELARWEEVSREIKVLELTQSARADFLHLKGLAALRQGQPAQALEPLQLAHQQAPRRGDIAINLASALLQLGRAEEALPLLKGQTSGEGGLLQGQAYYQLGRRREAEDTWRASAEQSPEAALNLASSLAEGGQDGEAMRVVAQGLDRFPTHRPLNLLYARLLNRALRFDEAWTQLRPLVEEGGEPYLYELAGWTLLGLQRNEESLQLLRKAVQLGASGAALENNLALVLGRLGKVEEALPHQQAACRLQPELASAWYHLGLLYELNAQPRQALQAYEEFLKRAPQDPAAQGLKDHLSELKRVLSKP